MTCKPEISKGISGSFDIKTLNRKEMFRTIGKDRLKGYTPKVFATQRTAFCLDGLALVW